MTRFLSLLAALSVVIPSARATAQEFHSQPLHNHGHFYGHDYWHPQAHVPNVAQLDEYADQLAKIARHLHEDAHKLSQDYEHSESIEHYVDRIDRLQQHMHELLHEAVESGTQSSGLTAHIKRDVREVRNLLNRLGVELHHQGVDGARTEDYHAMVHMRQIMSAEAFPLVRQLEVGLYGYAPYDHLHSFHSRPLGARTWINSRIRVHH